ncbi:membrane protein DedA, SNARE-associated domain [Arboricoccus pini]|uniref:Membrane protein DedA, SNARE-associated domain n=1 Tax=Arboricoccus pini TaxID=1963835 RepID=A0A212PVN4_9PROT|nr:DedA family protein [Arboricoccus pini]SNB51026.1 membrane protein DedA, SNARE-associated domain [Arboricoccus pini]
MSFADVSDMITAFVRLHQGWTAPIVFLLAFGESIAFLSILIPATVILLAVGALIGQANLPFLPIWLAAVLGATLGDWLSYWVGDRYKEGVARMWPLSRTPELLPRGYAFFQRYGWLGVFGGRFLGPLRASVPLVAGICAMPFWPFQTANLFSAVLWAFLMLAPGAYGIGWLEGWLG